MVRALQAAKEKQMSVRKAALQYGIPYQTLRDRVSGKIDNDSYGRETIFSRDEELLLVEHAANSARLGYGISNSGFQRLAGELVVKLGKRQVDKPLSNCWLYGFLGRWKEQISSLKPSAIDFNRARSTTPENVEEYFSNLKTVMTDLGLLDKPEYVYNVDETGISPENRPPNVIAPTKEKPQSVTSPRSATTTLKACANAAGNHIPPYFVFKGKRVNPELMKGTPTNARHIMTETGWSTTAVFREYLDTHFLQYVNRGSDEQPVLLVLDGHTTHTSLEIREWARSKAIHLFVLPAHTSHLLQRLDVAHSAFGPFKRYYYSECAQFMKDNLGQVVTRYNVASIACKAYLKSMVPWNIMSAFRKTGIHPLNKEAIPKDQMLPCEAFRDETPILKAKAVLAGKEAGETYLHTKMQGKTPASQSQCKCKAKAKKPVHLAGRSRVRISKMRWVSMHPKRGILPQRCPFRPICRQPCGLRLDHVPVVLAMP